MNLRRLFRCAGGAYTPTPSPTPTPTPTPTPSIATLSPGASWNGTAGSGGTAPTADTDTQRINLATGLGWPDQPNIALNMDDYMTIEQAGGYTGFAVLEPGHDDGFDPCTVWCEGTSISVSPALLPNIDGKAQYGLAFQLTAPAGKGGLATVKIIARPKRGYEREFSCTVWLNDNGAVVRPQYWIDPSGNDSTGAGTFASPWKTFNYASLTGLTIGSNATTGLRVMCKSAGTYYFNQGTPGSPTANLTHTGPVTLELGPGLSPGDAVFHLGTENDGTDRIGWRNRRLEMWGIWTECSAPLVRGIIPGSTFTNGGNTLMRDGCRIYDSDGSAGALDHGYPAGFASIGGGNLPRSHRFFDPDGGGMRIGFLGSASSKSRMDLTHVAGGHVYINFDCTYGWAGPFPRGCALDNDFRVMNSKFKGYGNMWTRFHSAVTGSVVSIGSRNLNGTTVWDVVTDLADLTFDWPVDANGNSTIQTGLVGETWMLAFGASVAVGGGTQFHGANGPAYPLNRDGTRDFPWLGWAVKGLEIASKKITLNSQPVGLAPGDQVRVMYAHGNDQIFIQGLDPAMVGNLENVTFYNTQMEAPEGYFIAQQAGGRGYAGTGTCSFDGANQMDFSSAQTLYKGDTITLASNESAVVRKVVSTTRALLYDRIDGTGTPLRPFSGSSFSGQSFYVGKAVVGLAFVNTFTYGSTAGAQLGDGGFQGMFVRGSTLDWESLTDSEIFFYSDQARRPQTFFRSLSIANSYISGLGTEDPGISWPAGNMWARGNQYGKIANRDTDGGGTLSKASFTSGLAGTISKLALSAPIAAMPVDINGTARVAAVSRVGAVA